MQHQNMRCLLIDDRIEEHLLFKNALEMTGLPVTCEYSTNANKELEVLKRSEPSELPHIIFLDVYMPGMDGKKFLAAIKQEKNLKNIPVYMYTSSTDTADIQELIKGGSAYYIIKTSNLESLSKSLKVLLGRMVSGG
jgi:CheY-like chemotaxis protein